MEKKKEHVPDYKGLKVIDIARELKKTPAEVLEIFENLQRDMESYLINKGLVKDEKEAELAVRGLILLQPDGNSYIDITFFDQFKSKKKCFHTKVKMFFNRD